VLLSRRQKARRQSFIWAVEGLGANEAKLLQFLFGHPLTDVQTAQKQLGVVYNTAATAIGKLEKARLLKETTGAKRNRVFRFAAYLNLFESPA
jgi:Fic family protein